MDASYHYISNYILSTSWSFFLALYCIINLTASRFVLLKECDSKQKLSWLAIIWLSPFIGAFLYLILGINRIERKGQKIRQQKLRLKINNTSLDQDRLSLKKREHTETLPVDDTFVQAMGKMTQYPLIVASSIEILPGGVMAYQAMLEAINNACKSVYLQTYIFDRGQVGDRFIIALNLAKQRGIEVCVLIDAIGSKYSFPSSYSQLKKLGVNCRKFLPNRFPSDFAFINLRNHRKILIIDNQKVFTGGMNIRDSHCQLSPHSSYTEDLQFSFEGPIVNAFYQIFIEDWQYSGGGINHMQHISRACYDNEDNEKTLKVCRVIPDGPDFIMQKIKLTNLLAIGFAKESVDILTPYFLPDEAILDALSLAALKGVRIRILVPKKGNIPLINWAMTPQFSKLIKHGCEIYLSDFSFDHSKLMVVDDNWSCIGSANWDIRSYKLNFEVNIEIYDRQFSTLMSEIFQKKLLRAQLLSLLDLSSRPKWVSFRDQIFSLMAPYLIVVFHLVNLSYIHNKITYHIF